MGKPPGTDRLCFSLSCFLPLSPSAPFPPPPRWRPPAGPTGRPAAAILLWQALGLSWGLAAVGALAGLVAVRARWGVVGGVLAGAAQALRDAALGSTAATLIALARLAFLVAGAALLILLCWVLLAASTTVLLARRRHRVLLSLLAHGDPKVPGALVVDSPAAAAYCVPGLRSRIVISAGTLALLDAAELAAVLAHERAHVRARHDLVLLPVQRPGPGFPPLPPGPAGARHGRAAGRDARRRPCAAAPAGPGAGDRAAPGRRLRGGPRAVGRARRRPRGGRGDRGPGHPPADAGPAAAGPVLALIWSTAAVLVAVPVALLLLPLW